MFITIGGTDCKQRLTCSAAFVKGSVFQMVIPFPHFFCGVGLLRWFKCFVCGVLNKSWVFVFG